MADKYAPVINLGQKKTDRRGHIGMKTINVCCYYGYRRNHTEQIANIPMKQQDFSENYR
jgi:hypothetical protein